VPRARVLAYRRVLSSSRTAGGEARRRSDPSRPVPADTDAATDSAGRGRAGFGVQLESFGCRHPAAVRPALAQAAADELDTITAVLIDAATNTTRPVWTTPACPECGTQFRQEVHVPDHKARVAAVEVLLREGLGRPGQAEEPTQPTVP
jgi:hypothetical protein